MRRHHQRQPRITFGRPDGKREGAAFGVGDDHAPRCRSPARPSTERGTAQCAGSHRSGLRDRAASAPDHVVDSVVEVINDMSEEGASHPPHRTARPERVLGCGRRRCRGGAAFVGTEPSPSDEFEPRSVPSLISCEDRGMLRWSSWFACSMVVFMSPPGNATGAQAKFDEQVVPQLEILYRTARSLTRSSSDAEDLVQETLLRAFRAIDRFDGRYPRAWLLTIMRNANINRARKKTPDLLDDPEFTFERSMRFADTTTPGGRCRRAHLRCCRPGGLRPSPRQLPQRRRTGRSERPGLCRGGRSPPMSRSAR